MNPLIKAIKTVRYLGLPKLWLYTRYQIGLHTGYYHRLTPSKMTVYSGQPGLPPYKTFPKIDEMQYSQLLYEAEQIRHGYTRLFGGELVPLNLKEGSSTEHWSALESVIPNKDIKFIWEPARFGWAVTLARAYAYSKDSIYAKDFWDKTLIFLAVHPPNLGRQWQSAQEVAIRIMVFVFCDRVFAGAPFSTPENRRRLWQAIAEHAQRIPPTLIYARAQNNNHLLSEALGLFTAGTYLTDHPHAQNWRKKGWRWINWALQNQIDEFGTYIQNSTNYHRLMLQLALYTHQLIRLTKRDWPGGTNKCLENATRWLWALTDPETGLVPNLGANDSAYIFPFTQLHQEDFRPVVDAAAKAFLKIDVYQQPEFAEMAGLFEIDQAQPIDIKQPLAPNMLQVSHKRGRAFIHTPQFTERPSHADQLHVDLWWQGINVALDPGTFQYNAPSPWDNALLTARVHNTLTLDGHDQMSRSGRFLWLDWAQAEILAHEIDDYGKIKRVAAEHNGFRKLGASHRRTLENTHNGWRIEDTVYSIKKRDNKIHEARLTWLLPDWDWTLEAGNQLKLTGPSFSFQLQIDGVVKFSIFRAGERLIGDRETDPTWGWISPTYGIKQPGLMVKALRAGPLPIKFQSYFQFN